MARLLLKMDFVSVVVPVFQPGSKRKAGRVDMLLRNTHFQSSFINPELAWPL